MIRFKPVLTRGFFIWICAVIIYAAVQVFRGMEPLLSWIGLDLTALPLMVFFASYFRNAGAAVKSNTLGYTLVSGLGLVICMAVSYRYGETAGIVHIWAGITFVAWVLLLRAGLKD